MPQFVADLIRLLLDLALPSAICCMVLAGIALRREGGLNFEMGGRFQRWILWTVIFLTVPQTLSWFAAQGVTIPATTTNTSPWLANVSTIFSNFVSDVLVGKLTPILAAFFVLKALLDAAQGENPLSSLLCAIFLLSVSSSIQLMQKWNSGTQFAATDMLASAWNYLASTILPEAAGLAVVGAIFNYVRHKPVTPLISSGLAFLSVSAIWKLVQAMVSRG